MCKKKYYIAIYNLNKKVKGVLKMFVYSYVKNERELGIVWLTEVKSMSILNRFKEATKDLVFQMKDGSRVTVFNGTKQEVEKELENVLSKLCLNLVDTKATMERIKLQREELERKEKELEIARAKAEKEAELERLQKELLELK